MFLYKKYEIYALKSSIKCSVDHLDRNAAFPKIASAQQSVDKDRLTILCIFLCQSYHPFNAFFWRRYAVPLATERLYYVFVRGILQHVGKRRPQPRCLFTLYLAQQASLPQRPITGMLWRANVSYSMME